MQKNLLHVFSLSLKSVINSHNGMMCFFLFSSYPNTSNMISILRFLNFCKFFLHTANILPLFCICSFWINCSLPILYANHEYHSPKSSDAQKVIFVFLNLGILVRSICFSYNGIEIYKVLNGITLLAYYSFPSLRVPILLFCLSFYVLLSWPQSLASYSVLGFCHPFFFVV